MNWQIFRGVEVAVSGGLLLQLSVSAGAVDSLARLDPDRAFASFPVKTFSLNVLLAYFSVSCSAQFRDLQSHSQIYIREIEFGSELAGLQ